MKGDFAKFYLRKYCKDSQNKSCDNSIQNEKPYKIWQYWEQGLENAPEIVHACLDSVQRFNPNIERVILSYDTIKEYVEIPEYIYKLKEKGIIKLAHFSDILRTYLLIEHGGCWIDATVLMTAPLPQYIKDADLFMFQADEKADLDGLNMTSYFISTKPNNKVLLDAKSVFEKYWSENNFLVNYFMFLHTVTMISKYNKDVWNKIPFYSFIPVQQMQSELMRPYSKERFEQLKNTTPIHKLSYKPKVMGMKKNTEIENTLYQAIIEGRIYE